MKRMIGVLTLSILVAPALFAQMPAGEKPAMSHDCAAMMKQHEGVKKDMAAMDAKLQALVDEMNKAKGTARIDKTAAVVTELVAQRSRMRTQMADMQPKMAEHMKEHMHAAMMKGMADSAAGCPMMKAEGEAAAPVAAGHKH